MSAVTVLISSNHEIYIILKNLKFLPQIQKVMFCVTLFDIFSAKNSTRIDSQVVNFELV